MKQPYLLIISIFLLEASAAFSQNTFPASGAAGIGTTTPNASSLLDITSTTKGVLVPRMTKAQRDAIATPATGLLIYQTNNTAGFYYFSGTSWIPVSAKSASQALDNLTLPTSINVDLLPGTDNTINLGSATKSWQDVFVDGSLRFGDGSVQTTAPITYTNGTGINIAGNVISNTAPDQTVTISGSGATTVTGSYPNFTVSSTVGQTLTAGTGISISGGNVISNTGDVNQFDDANLSLSNLTSTFINQSLLPNADNTLDEGSIASSWKDIYLDGKLFLDGTVFLDNKGSQNTWVGNTGNTTNSGTSNTATGDHALQSNAAGSSNTANGAYALSSNTSGNDNTAIGGSALSSNTTGNENTANGIGALFSNLSGYNNTATGVLALYSNLASNNTANGAWALFNNTTGSYNTATGSMALYSNTTASNNTANGYSALYTNTTGYGNTASGYAALYLNTTGYYNTGTGMNALISNNTGHDNTANGVSSLLSNTSGYFNTAVGRDALSGNNTGHDNTAVGYSTGSYNDLNTYCSFLGADADQSVTTNFNNSTAIGYISRITASNQVRIGNSSVTSIGGYAFWSNVSDGRYKKDVKENVPGLEFINKLRPVTYHLDVEGLRTFTGEDMSDANEDHALRKVTPDEKMQKSIDEKEKILYTGFIAQEVEKAASSVGYDFSGVDKPQNDASLYGLRYAEFVVPLVKAVQQLSEKHDSLMNDVDAIEADNQAMHAEMDSIKSRLAALNSGAMSKQQVVIDAPGEVAYVMQNVPNPFSGKTSIPYFIPANAGSAKIIFRNENGIVLKTVDVVDGKGTVDLDISALAAGVYGYELVVDGKVMDEKRMVMQK